MTVRTVLASDRDERMRVPVVVVATAAALVALVATLVSTSEPLVAAIVLGAGIVVGEVFVLRWPPAGEVAASYAVFLVLARAVDVRVALVTIVAAELVTLVGEEHFRAARWRAGSQRCCGRGHSGGIPPRVRGARSPRARDHRAGCTARERGRRCRGRREHAPRRARDAADLLARARRPYAWAAVIGTGVLMALAVRGVNGDGALGVRRRVAGASAPCHLVELPAGRHLDPTHAADG